MYIHIGGDKMLRTADIVVMIDYDCVSESTINAEFTNKSVEKVFVSTTSVTKAIVVTDKVLYYSPLATQTLQKRMDQQTNERFLNR